MSEHDPTHEARSPAPRGTGEIGARLHDLRRGIRSSVAFRGSALLVLCALGIAIVSFAIDRIFRLTFEVRAAAAAVYGAALVWLAFRFIVRPVCIRLPDRILADLIERRFPFLLDRFRSAVEFLRDPRVLDDSPTDDIQVVLKRKVVAEALDELERLDVGDVIDTPRVATSVAAGTVGVGAAIVLAALFFPTLRTWFERNVLLAAVEWPYRTRLAVDGFPSDTLERGVPRGDSLKIVVRAEGEVPERVRIRVAYARESFRANLVREGEAAFVHEHTEVTEPFTFTVEGGDYRSHPHRVVVQERPEVEKVRVIVAAPPYTGRPEQSLEGDIGELAVPEGSTVRLEGIASKALRGARLEVEGSPIDLTVEPSEPRRFAGAYAPRQGGMATLHLEDLEGVPPNQWFRFLVTPVPDRVPVVQARAEGVGSMITPNARIPLKVKAADDYAVIAIGVEHDVIADKEAPVKGSTPFPPLRAQGPAIEEEPVLEVGPLKIEPGRRLDLRIYAVDNDGLHGSKNGFAATQSFLVVTAERLGEEFLRREEEQRRLVERIVADERAVRDAVYRLIDEAWKEAAPLSEAVVKEMVGIGRQERQLARQVSGVTGAMKLLREEMKNNRVGEVEEADRLLSSIIEPLIDVAERLLPDAAVKVGAIREMQKPDERLRDGLVLAGDIESMIQRLEAVLQSMKRLEGFTEIVTRLRGILKIHDESVDQAEKLYKREVKRIFEPLEESGEEGSGPPRNE